jgi:hypothetical protein
MRSLACSSPRDVLERDVEQDAVAAESVDHALVSVDLEVVHVRAEESLSVGPVGRL